MSVNPHRAVTEEAKAVTAGAFTVGELLDRADADATFARVADAVGASALPEQEIVVTLTALAVLRAREAADRAEAEATS